MIPCWIQLLTNQRISDVAKLNEISHSEIKMVNDDSNLNQVGRQSEKR